MLDLQTLRQQLKKQRRALSPQQQTHASLAISAHIADLAIYRRAQHIGAYLAVNGEINPRPLMELALAQGKQVWVPVLHPFLNGQLWWVPWHMQMRYRKNQFGIDEPVFNPKQRRHAKQLDMVLTPLLGFDKTANRLGMGGGYYDRSFAFRRIFKQTRKPFLLGIAHDVQLTDALPKQPWDVPLDGVITPTHCYSR